ncbi:RluA family pseudouridine synthase [Acetobacter sp.]|jgi:tRNA pseudouridine32 synthase/23S rRNA pseudouridine746 synthase|uniref:RluA family pseudouridine synthase n=1 Tax=Acetobacter sp. TaxID=440 RepID=UPI0025C6C80F|nr:RNA pseudouridine synthase [Acetobacter sp.]MCH4090174.1 RNA pseudouridine synthase [Acetobacter sp.]MCI1298868.1 RNA pseudouridine synthase [Acetobacter sp.]MCI1314888.1 RNA pseudouridine synthase [Acetobacter sp.]
MTGLSPTLPFEMLYESNQALIINKPAGLPVHPGPRGGPSVEDWFPLMSRRKDGPWLAHRLDADTAGCLAIALRKQTLLAMQSCFSEGRTRKIYWAIVQGVSPETAEIDEPLKKISTKSGGWRMCGAPDGQSARTTLRRLGTDGVCSWVELTLHTGRTHQARIHCALLGTPILDDPIYAEEKRSGSGPLQLLSRELTLQLPTPIRAVAPPPLHMEAALRRCGYHPPAG